MTTSLLRLTVLLAAALAAAWPLFPRGDQGEETLSGAAELLASGAGAPWQALALALLAVLWGLSKPPRRQTWVGALGLGLAVALAFAAWGFERAAHRAAEDGWVIAAEAAYVRLCDELTTVAAETAASMVELAAVTENQQLVIFRHLQELLEEPPLRGRTVVFFDPDNEAVAWAGEGLPLEPNGFSLPRQGLAWRRGYSSISLFAIAPVNGDERPYRLLVGDSFTTRELSFMPARDRPAEGAAWTLAKVGSSPSANTWRIAPEGKPMLLIEPRETRRSDEETHASSRFTKRWWATAARTAVAAVIGLTLLTLAFAPRVLWPVGTSVILTMSGTAVWATAAELPWPFAAAPVLSVGLAVWGLLRPRPNGVGLGGGEVPGALALVVLAVAAWFHQRGGGHLDLAANWSGSAELWALRLTGGLAALGFLALASRQRNPEPNDRAGWLAMLLLTLAAAFHDQPLPALALLAAGGGAAARWIGSLDLTRRPMALGGVLLLAATAGAVAWEIAYREVFRLRIEEEYLPLVTPPTLDEINDVHVEIDEYFNGFELRRTLPPGAEPTSVDFQDLAFALWYDSPLPERDGASAVIIAGDGGRRSSFSFGLPLDRELQVSEKSERWPIPSVPAWRDAAIIGEGELLLDGRPWGRLEYWFLPRPGFRFEVSEITELEAALVRGDERRRAIDGLPRPVLFGLYALDGKAISSPWEESTPLDAAVLDELGGVVRTPSGRTWYRASQSDDLVEVLYLPLFTPREGLERVGVHALGTLGVIAVLLLWVFGLAQPPGDLRGLVDGVVHSYSKRLILVYASLLLVPLVALNLVLLRGFEERMRHEQQAQGQAALTSARLILLDYLKGIGAGFSLESEINRELLEWISGLVRHPVNLYWNSRVLASSQQELFTAGLLPERIPGDVFSRLSLLGHEVGARTQHTGEETYLELYAPLEAFGGLPGLFLSVPLLELEEEFSRELETLRRRAVLVTSALVFLVLAVGSRLAASFTAPIMELIDGTRKIAGGAPFLGVTPRERELSALADAIDDMAQRIAAGRHELVLEKEFARRMVENVNSGVVSLDHSRRVLLHNRVAAKLLGAEVGRPLEEIAEHNERLQPVVHFLGEAEGGELRAETVQLIAEDGEVREWTLTWVPLPGPEDPAALVVVDDNTEVLRGQRLEAWAEMARIIAHEIKNPLTPIRLSAEHLRTVYKNDPDHLDEVFERCTQNILKQVEELRDIASDFSIYARIPRAELAPGDLVASMRELTAAYLDSTANVDLVFESEHAEIHTRFDAKLLGRAVRNLLENALRASAAVAERSQVLLAMAERDGKAEIAVVDSGPGVDPDNLSRIFEPYFSTHETGTGLGLAIAKRIVEEHGGRLEARNRSGGGLAMMISIPMSDSE